LRPFRALIKSDHEKTWLEMPVSITEEAPNVNSLVRNIGLEIDGNALFRNEVDYDSA
jgi:hypothetical protein